MTELPLYFDDALSLAEKLHKGEISSLSVTEMMLSRINTIDAEFGAYATTTAELALQQAEKADSEISRGKIRSPLHGVPIAVKDLLDTKGIPSAYGMPLYAEHKPTTDATVVRKLAEAGTVLLGKTKLTEGAFVRHHPAITPPVNPWNPECWAGVSSSGSGVATAAGLCYASIGTDTGGSIRFPSALNGLVGLKPTWGRVSRHGVFPLAYSLDHVGPMTRSVGDAAAMLHIIAGLDALDATSSPREPSNYLGSLNKGVSGLRIGIDQSYVATDTDSELVDAVNEVADCLQGLGCKLVDITIAYGNLCDGWAHTAAVEAAHGHRETFPEQKEKYGSIKELLDFGLSTSAESYMQMEMARRVFKAQLEATFQSIDIILCPSMPAYAPPKEGSAEMDQVEQALSNMLKFTAPYNYSGSPTLSLPWRPGSKNIPVGVQLIGRDFEEGTLLQVGKAIEQYATPAMHPKL